MVGGGRQRLVLQLTSLLDLLLIVIFAQYMEVDAAAQQEVAQARQQAREAWQRADARVGAEIDAIRQQAEAQLRGREGQIERLEQKLLRLARELAAARGQTEAVEREAEQNLERLASIAGELLNVPAEELLRDLRNVDAERREALQRQVAELHRAAPGELAQRLLTIDELRKRADVWNIYLDAENYVTISKNNELVARRYFGEPGAFRDYLYEAVATGQEPKGLVLFLYGCHWDCLYRVRMQILEDLRQAVADLSNHYEFRAKHFEFSVMPPRGTRKQGDDDGQE